MSGFIPDQDVGVLDRRYLHGIEHNDCSRYEVPFLNGWAYQPLLELEDAVTFNMNTSPQFNPLMSLDASWPTPDYASGSSHSSDRSLSGSAPSSITSYNEFDQGTLLSGSPSPCSPQLARTTSPESILYSDVAPLSHIDQPVTTNSPIQPVATSLVTATTDVVTCPECCKRKTFGRKFELNRHIKEQHRCSYENCAELKFSTQEAKRNHEKTHGDVGPGFHCGICLLDGTPTNTHKRLEKLKNHFRAVHGHSIPFDLTEFQCKQGSCFSCKSGGVFFDSDYTLTLHQRQHHGSSLQISRASSCTPLSENQPSNNSGKRAFSSTTSSGAKRSKHELIDIAPNDHSINVAANAKLSRCVESSQDKPESSAPSVRDNISALQLSNGDSSAIEEYLPVSIMELRALTKHKDWKSLLSSLRSLEISASFDGKQAAIKLRSKSSAKLKQGKTHVQKLKKSICTSTTPLENPDPDVYTTSKATAHQQVSFHPQPEIMPLDEIEDADTLALYHDILLPKFPNIVQDSMINGTYSVSLVRQRVPEGTCLVLRFRSSENPSTCARQNLRQNVKSVCLKYGKPPLHIQFSQGTLVCLVGGVSEAMILDDPSDDHRFPHQRRFWGTPGMGASIGPSKCKHVSATSGGMISVDSRLYMLTVDHFISACQKCERTNEVQSPSISDICSVKQQLAKKFQELSLKTGQTVTEEVSLDQVDGLYFPQEVDEEMEQYKRIEEELAADNSEFKLGTVRLRCGPAGVSQTHLRQSINSHSRGAYHRMDWSLTEITVNNRKGGRNVHRFGRVADPSLHDLTMEVMNPEGAGSPCSSTTDVTGGEQALYVGTTSGLRTGTVNKALVQHRNAYGNISNEWSMIVPECNLLRSTDFQGDSGAWIIRDDNKLMGQLWGWDNGYLLFTPIQDIFADIAQKKRLSAHLVGLPEYSGPRSEHQDGLLCRIDSLPEVFVDTADDHYDPALLSPRSTPVSRRTSRASSWGSVESIPSLMSSASSASSPAESVHARSDRLSTSPPTPVHGSNLHQLPIRTKDRVAPNVSVEKWVCILPDGEAIDQKLSNLQLATDTSIDEATCRAIVVQ